MIIGGGFGGLYAARALAGADVDVTLIDRKNHHTFQPLLYQVATAGLNPADIAVPIRRILRKQKNVRVLLAEAEGVDVDAKEVRLHGGGTLEYDFLVVATGATHSYFAHPEWEKIAPGLKTIEDALEMRKRLFFAFEAAEREEDPERFRDVAADPQVKMIEIKLSQGAKPGHGGVLPGAKVTHEIAEARGIEIGQTCVSPPAHSAFSTPIEMMEFVAKLRELSGGKPVGAKFAVGNRWEVLALCKAMLETGILLDFMVVDGGEGGTGAAPAEFLDHVGAPLRQGLVLTRNALVGTELKDKVRLACSGKQVSAFAIASSMALGADWVNTARGFMFSLGCIQSLNCHNNRCPTGIATSDKSRQRGLVVSDKAVRVANFHRNTVKALMEVVGAAGCQHPGELTPRHIMHRVTEDIVRPADEAYDLLMRGQLLSDPEGTHLASEWRMAQAGSFRPAGA